MQKEKFKDKYDLFGENNNIINENEDLLSH